MAKHIPIPKWVDKVITGTKEGDEEYIFFIALARHPEYAWRSVSAIAKESGLSQERVEEILVKYVKKHMIIAHATNPNHWGYWERVPKDQLPTITSSISNKDKKDRVDKALRNDYDGGLFSH